MRPFRKNSLSAKLLNIFSQILILAFSFLFCLWMISGAKADPENNLSEVRSILTDNVNTIEIQFTGEIAAGAVKSNYERNFLQFSIENVTAFPAKTTEIGDKLLEKVYAYQYQPNLARARIYLGAKISEIQPALSWKVEKNKIVLTFEKSKFRKVESDKHPAIKTVSITDTVVNSASTSDRAGRTSDKESVLNPEEEVLLQKMSERANERKAPKTNAAQNSATPAALASAPKEVLSEKTEDKQAPADTDELFAGMKHDAQKASVASPSSGGFGFGKLFLNLGLVLALIAAVAWGFRKFVLNRGLNLGMNSKAIRVLSTYTMSPGKQITVIKVADEILVLGVAGNNINLISTLDRASGIDKYFNLNQSENPPGPRGFTELLGAEIGEEIEQGPVSSDAAPGFTKAKVATEATTPSVREAIKNRIRGFKQLS